MGSSYTPQGPIGSPLVNLSGTPTSGQVPTATSGSAATWQTPGGGGAPSGPAGGDLSGTYPDPTVLQSLSLLDQSGRFFWDEGSSTWRATISDGTTPANVLAATVSADSLAANNVRINNGGPYSQISSLATGVRTVTIPDSDGSIALLAASPVFVAPESGGDPSDVVSNYSGTGINGTMAAALNLTSAGLGDALVQDEARLKELINSVQAILTAFQAGNYPALPPP